MLQKSQSCALFDPGLSVHLTYLQRRLEEVSLRVEQVQELFLTHLHPERIGGIPLLRKHAPNLCVYGTSAMQKKLADPEFARKIYDQDRELSQLYPKAEPAAVLEFEEYHSLLRIDHVFPESEVFEITPELRVRCVRAPGHTPESLAYLIEPYDFLVVDEGFGYFRGKDLAAPGCDWDIAECLATVEKFKDVELSAICFPNAGLITGQLVRNHIAAILQNIQDLRGECRKAAQSGVSIDEIRVSLRRSFYTSTSKDPLAHRILERSFQDVWKQVHGEAPADGPSVG